MKKLSLLIIILLTAVIDDKTVDFEIGNLAYKSGSDSGRLICNSFSAAGMANANTFISNTIDAAG